MAQVVLGPLADFPDGRGVARRVDGRALAVFRFGERVFVVDDRCPHRGFPLHDGTCDGTSLRCRTHGATFALASGAPLSGPARRGVRTYAVELVDGVVTIAMN